jgi:chromate transporter
MFRDGLRGIEVEEWMTARQFTDIFAIAQGTPGPNAVIVSLIGYHVAGVLGATVATLAMCGPTSRFAFCVGHAWQRFKDAPQRAAIQAGCFRSRSAESRRARSLRHR